MDRPTEQDLLALIEGELAPERRAAVESALRADPALAERVRRMAADREGLRELGATDRAPRGVVDEAMAKADQNELVQVDTGGPVRSASLARGSRGRRVQMAAAAGIGIGLVGVWVWLMLMVSSPSGGVEPRQMRGIELVDRTGEDAAPAGLADATGPEDIGPAAPQREPEVDEPSLAEMLPRSIDEPERAGDGLLGEWMANIGEPGGEAGVPGLERVDFRRAAELALDGRLRIEILGDGSGGLLLADGGRPTWGAPGRRPSLEEMAEDGWRAELEYRADSSVADLALALERMVTELEARTGHRVCLRPIESGAPDADAAPAPVLEASSVLWWGEPASQWATRMVVRPVVRLADEGERPDERSE